MALCLTVPQAASAQDCANAAIRAQQGPTVEALPDCMALERVSPAEKFSQNVASPQVSSDGGRVLFVSRGALGGATGLFGTIQGDPFVASRDATGWTTSGAVVSGPETADYQRAKNRGLSPDFSRWVAWGATEDQRSQGRATVFQAHLLGGMQSLAVPLNPLDGVHQNSNVDGLFFQGLSADHSRLFVVPGDASTTYLSGDESASAGADRNLYLAKFGAPADSALELVARDGSGTVWGGRCGTRLGGVRGTEVTGTNLRNQGAVSADGRRIYFSTRPTQPAGSACSPFIHPLRILTRTETPDGPVIDPLVPSSTGDCDRPAGDPSGLCSAVDGDDLYQGASVDGTLLYFTTTRQLTDTDTDVGSFESCSGTTAAEGCDLYLYDANRPPGERLIQVSAGEQGSPTPGDGAGVYDGIAAISGDGTHAYFVATGVLTTAANAEGNTPTAGQPNLYAYTHDPEGSGELAFVGELRSDDANTVTGSMWNASGTFKDRAYPVPVTSGQGPTDTEGGDGHVLFFETSAALTADDTDGTRGDVYRYDATTSQLVRISAAAPDGVDGGAFDATGRPVPHLDDKAAAHTAFAEIDRWVSEDGTRVLFRTAEGLAADDDNATTDTYLWREGSLHRLPGTTAPPPTLPTGAGGATMSHDGSTIALATFSQLLSEDGDLTEDVYVMRAGGGFAVEKATDCDPLADNCRGGGSGPVLSETNTSSSAGSGNVSVERRKTLALFGLSKKARKGAARRGVLSVQLRSSSIGRVRLTAKAKLGTRVARVGRTTVVINKTEATTVKLDLNRRARKHLRSGKALRVTIQVRQTGARTRTRSILLPGVKS